MTIGNLPKDIRKKPSKQGQILLAYLPVTHLDHITNKAARRRMQANLFHRCLQFILKPIIKPGTDGIVMRSGNGNNYNTHPIFAIHVGDYPEQCQVTCVKNHKCPSCLVDPDERGDWKPDWIKHPPLYDLNHILKIMDNPFHEDWPKLCEAAGVRPVFNPYWKDLPYADPFLSICPDILHQIYQGIIKHLIAWLKVVYGEAEIDARARRLPPNHHIRIFSNGFCHLSRLTGREHADICRVILGIIIDIPIKNHPTQSTSQIIRAVCALLDFAYLAQYPVHSSQTLGHMMEALHRFHENKDIFIQLGARLNFNINKLHFALHYRLLVERYGTTDNYNTEHTERLHIPYAKDAFEASNGKNEYPQMTHWVERKEKILDHDKYLSWYYAGCPPLVSIAPAQIPDAFQMTKHPSEKAVSFEDIVVNYNAHGFQHALIHFIVKKQQPHLSFDQVEAEVPRTPLAWNTVAVYHKARFWLGNREVSRLQSDEFDVVHANPKRINTQDKDVPARGDTVLVNEGTGEYIGLKGHRIAQVKVIFSLSKRAIASSFPSHYSPPQYLAYVEWFSKFDDNPLADHQFYQVKKLFYQGRRVGSVIPLANITRSVHLFPKFDPVNYRKWTSATVLEDCSVFYLNHFSDRNAFHTMI